MSYLNPYFLFQNFTCPHCSDGFIEELQEPLEANADNVEVDDWEDDDVSKINCKMVWGLALKQSMFQLDNMMTSLPLHLMEERRPGRMRSDRGGRRYAVSSRSRTLSRPRCETIAKNCMTKSYA